MPILMMELTRVPDVRHPLHKRRSSAVLYRWRDRANRYRDDMFELPRLSQRSSAARRLAPADQVQAIVADLDAFAGDHEPDDDQTLLLIAIEEDVKSEA